MKTTKVTFSVITLVIFSIVAYAQTGTTPVGAQAVDLGLPSGTKWANINIGADKPEDYGLFFAWGETIGYGSNTSDNKLFSFENYKHGPAANKITKYDSTDGKITLDDTDDAARVNWGGKWRMPTYKEFYELLQNTTSEWTTINGINGYKFTSKKNNNFIFLPASGNRRSSNLNKQNEFGYYWSSSLSLAMPINARKLQFSSAGVSGGLDGARFIGYSIRPVQ